MPITKVIVRGKSAIRDILTWPEQPVKNLILIRNPDSDFEDTSNVPNVLGLKFWDNAPEWVNDETRVDTLLGFNHPLPSEEDLEKILDFLLNLEAIEEDETLWVSCNMGVSRSGAVGIFANQYFSLDYSEFKRVNPQVQPNPFIERELHRLFKERMNLE